MDLDFAALGIAIGLAAMVAAVVLPLMGWLARRNRSS